MGDSSSALDTSDGGLNESKRSKVRGNRWSPPPFGRTTEWSQTSLLGD